MVEHMGTQKEVREKNRIYMHDAMQLRVSWEKMSHFYGFIFILKFIIFPLKPKVINLICTLKWAEVLIFYLLTLLRCRYMCFSWLSHNLRSWNLWQYCFFFFFKLFRLLLLVLILQTSIRLRLFDVDVLGLLYYVQFGLKNRLASIQTGR